MQFLQKSKIILKRYETWIVFLNIPISPGHQRHHQEFPRAYPDLISSLKRLIRT
ncbi:hypothetical protein Hanom_Chr07g00604031 [Helianthus anomalus]